MVWVCAAFTVGHYYIVTMYYAFCHIYFFTMEFVSFCSFMYWLTGKLLKLPDWKQCICYRYDTQLLWVWVCACLFESLTDAGGHGWAALLITLGATVAGDAGDTVLARALSCGLVARLACCSHRMAVTSWGGGQAQVWRGEKGLFYERKERTSGKCRFIKRVAKIVIPSPFFAVLGMVLG